jgi:iron complex outermembrane recepter protein
MLNFHYFILLLLFWKNCNSKLFYSNQKNTMMKIFKTQENAWKTKNFKLIFSFLISFLFCQSSFAQQSIQGKVTDKFGAGLPAVSVQIKGTNTGTVANANGNFKIIAPNSATTLVLSFIGYKSKEVAIGGKNIINVSLEESAEALDEVVVTGLFDKRTALNSSIAISTIDAKQIEKQVPASAADLLKNVPGVYVNSSLGEVRNTVYSRGVTTGNNDGRWGYDYVSMQEDGLPVSNTLLANFTPDFFLRADATLSKLEAVRGGSASIVGANAPGGIFNYISKEGGDKFEAEVRARVGFEGNGKNPYTRGDFNFGGPLSKNLTYNIGGFYRNAQGPNYPGYASNNGGQVKGNIVYKYNTGSLKFIVKSLNDHNLSKEALPTTSYTDPTLVPGFTNTSSMLWPSMTATVDVPNRGLTTYDPEQKYHSKENKVGFKWDQELGSGWNLSNNMSYSVKTQDAFSPIGTVTPLDMTGFVSYIIAGSLHPGPPNDPSSFVVPGTYNFTTLSGTPVMTSAMGFDFSKPIPFDFKVTGNTGSAKTFAPNYLLFAPLIYNSNNAKEFMDQFVLNKKFGKSTINVGGFYASSSLDKVQESFGVTLNTFEPNPKPLNITLTAPGPNAPTFQITNPNGVSKLGADQGYTTFNATQKQMALFFAHTLEISDQLTFDWGLRSENLKIKGANQISNNVFSTTGGPDKNPLTLYDNNSNGPGAIFKYDKSKSYLSYSGALNYKINATSAMYLRYSNGKKAPGYQIYLDVTTPFAETSLDPQIQTIQQFELGFKVKKAGLTSNITPFYSLLAHIPNNVTFTNNTGNLYNPPALYNDIRTAGIEIDENYEASKHFNIRGVITLQTSKATKYDSWIHGFDGTDSKISNSGNQTANVPNVMLNITPEFHTEKSYVNLTWNFMGKRQANFQNAFTMNSFSQFNLAAGLNLTKAITLSGNINNLLNSYGVLGWVAPGTFPNNLNLESLSKAQVTANPTAFYETFGTPARAYFLSLSYKF